MVALFIDDGLTLEARLRPRGPWSGLIARFRPAAPLKVYDYLQAKKDTGKQRLDVTVAILKDHLVSWDAVDSKGETVPITAQALARLPQVLLEELLGHVMGYSVEEQEHDEKN